MANIESSLAALTTLADPTRRQVFELLAAHPRPVGQLAQALPVSRPAVSQHLRVLSEAGLVQVQAMGTRRIYSVRREGLAELRRYLDHLWGDVLQNFAAEIENRKEP